MAVMPARVQSRGTEIRVLLLLTLANGVVAFDRLTVAYLSPYIVADLRVSNTQLGLLAASLSAAVAVSSFVGGRLADRTGRRKFILLWCTIVFSIGSAAGGLAATFAALFAARAVLGLAEGPMVPISQTIMAETSAPGRRGVAMGFMQMVGAFGIAGVLGPIVATQLADAIGWRHTLFLSFVPGLLLAIGIARVLRPDPKQPSAGQAPQLGLLAAILALLKIPNMRVTLCVAAVFTAWLVLQNTFLAMFLTEVRHLSPTTAGTVIAMGGFAGIAGGVGLPFLSDRIGRRPVMVGAGVAGVICPTALLLLPSDPILLALAILLGWLPLGMAPLYCATVPTESVDPSLATSAVGLSMGIAELFGGVIVPPIAGRVADAFGLEAVFVICIGLALVAGVAALFLRETAPRIVGTEAS
jgi:predicted MFS family arabinose efflux permease